MSFKAVLCDTNKRDVLCRGIVSSIGALGMDANVCGKLEEMLVSGTPVQKNYL